jgi:hypothetical protein
MPTKYRQAQQFFQQALIYEGDECLLWPFSRDQLGYGMISVTNRRPAKMQRVHNLMCEKTYGLPPPNHESAHSCNVRHCIAKRHLSWKTHKANVEDSIRAGTHYKPRHALLTEDQVYEIRAATGLHRDIAARYGVSVYTVSDIKHERSWKHLPSSPPYRSS